MRYLQVVDKITVSETDTSGEMPTQVYECIDCIASNHGGIGQTWNPLVDSNGSLDDVDKGFYTPEK